MRAIHFPRGALTATCALGLILASGCSDENPGTDPTSDGDTDISAEFGGYTTADELPAFGDEDLADDLAGEVPVHDTVADEPETRALEDDPEARSFAVTLRWGVLERKLSDSVGDPPGRETVDWSGSLSTELGRIVLRHVYSFEAGDEVTFPRDDAAVLEWTSRTNGDVDGITVVLHVPGDLVADDSREALFLSTEAFEVSLSLAQLVEWNETYEVGDAGNQIRINAMESGAAVSARGWVLGRWGWDAAEDLGRFHGQWLHPRTGIGGFLRGHFEPDPASDQAIFYGKYINRRGDFEGLLRGTVQVIEGDLERGVGTFQGGWYSETGEAEGSVHGRWVTGGVRGGNFSGIWCATCPVRGGIRD